MTEFVAVCVLLALLIAALIWSDIKDRREVEENDERSV